MIHSWLTPKAMLKNSQAIHGRGIFVKKAITKGDKVLIYGGQKIDRNLAYFLDRHIGDYQIQVDDFTYIGPVRKEEIRPAHIINHSCLPNLGFSNANTLIAIRDIKKGEELTFDYAFCTSDGFWMKCQCRAKNCRKVITGDDWKNKQLQKKYRQYFPPYLREKSKRVSSSIEL